MKRVSFEVAKAIKDVGYPQADKNSGLTHVYPLEDHDDNFSPYTRIGKLTTNYHCQTFRVLTDIPFVVAPTVIEVWLWLWREKKLMIPVDGIYLSQEAQACVIESEGINCLYASEYLDPEDAIEKVIEYIVDNKILK